MEGTVAVKSAVDENEIVVACAYVGHEHESLKAALPTDFQARQYVAKFVNGELVAIETGRPEAAISRLLGSKRSPKADCKSCEQGICEDCAEPAIPSQ